ncbi:hypothetical protein ACEPAI_4310 [Sanghuangporus weigelae]
MTAAVTTTSPPAALIPTLNAAIDWLKPRRSVAITRLKNNGFALVVMLLVTQLAPIVPAPTTCLWLVATGGSGMNHGTRLLCWIELAIYTILFTNILQSYIAIRYPPPQCGPSGTPAKHVQLRSPPPTRPLKDFTPTISRMKSSAVSPFASPGSPSRSYAAPLSNSSPSPLQSSLNSSFSASLLSSPLGYRSRQYHTQPVRSLRGSLLSQFEDADDDDL